MEDSASQPICDVCLDFRIHVSSDTCLAEHTRPVVVFETSSKKGCGTCKALVAIFHAYFSDRTVQYEMQLVSLGHASESASLMVWESGDFPSHWLNACHEVYVLSYPNDPYPWPRVPAGTPISGDTGSDEAVSRVRRWLDICSKDHDSCPGPNASASFPTRLLRINGPRDVTLHISTVKEKGPYVCLSHCWGKRSIVQCTTSTLEDYQKRIPWNILPRTFQDAINFTHRLGFTYIWIDSLCIIQDSAEDWRLEASRMTSVYENSSLTLCADRSKDSSEGCYARSDSNYLSREWRFRDQASNSIRVHTRSALDHEDFRVQHGQRYNMLPLMRRGWAFQERLLSPRTVHFTAQELVWNCSATIVCECSGIRPGLSAMHELYMRVNLWPHGSVQDVHDQWNNIISTYSAKDLTFEADVFPALQGLAKKVPPKMGKYLAGLWSETLIQGLAWSSCGPKEHLRPERWRAPTWSWASTTGPVWWAFTPYDVQRLATITVTNAATRPKGDDPTGELLSGELVINGRAVMARVIHSIQDAHKLYPNTASLSFAYGTEEESPQNQDRYIGPVGWDYTVSAHGPDYVSNNSEVMLVKILDGLTPEGSLIVSWWLVLRSSSRDQGSFERLGIWCADRYDGSTARKRLEEAYSNSPEIEIRIV